MSRFHDALLQEVRVQRIAHNDTTLPLRLRMMALEYALAYDYIKLATTSCATADEMKHIIKILISGADFAIDSCADTGESVTVFEWQRAAFLRGSELLKNSR